MLMAVKNQLKVTLYSIKYALMREMLNKGTFLMNVLFMILNNASFIIQWLIIYSLRNDVGGYTFSDILLLWGFAASTYGFSHFFFKKCFSLSDEITNGKLDAYLVQPKNVLLSAITSDIEVSALGDMIYGIIMLVVSGITIIKLFLFILFTFCGGIIITSYAVILASLSFWFNRSDAVADTGNNMITHFATYPDGIFNGISRIILYTIVPVGVIDYIPIHILSNFSIVETCLVIGVTVLFVIFAYIVFYKGLKRYSSSSLMIAKI